MMLNLEKMKRYENYFFLVIVLVFLQLSFNYNFFNGASDRFFKNHQKDSEALVIGKMIHSEYNGIINKDVLGVYGDFQNTYNLYLTDGNEPTTSKSNYTSSFGLQGYLYSIVDKILNIFNIGNKDKLNILYFLTSLLLSITLTIFAFFIKKEFGILSSIFLVVGVIYSQWLVVFAKNLYWTFFFILVPFVYAWVSLQLREKENNLSHKVYLIIFLLIFFKSLAGFEYLSTIFISLGIPYIYFAIKNNWKFLLFIKRIVLVYLYALAGFISAVVMYVIQEIFILGSFDKVIATFTYTIKKRTHGNPDEVAEVFRRSLESGYGEVILKYWNGKAFDLSSIFGKFTFITFGEIIIFFFAITILFIIFYKTKLLKETLGKKGIALLVVSWVSVLAPLSWYVLAKGHSYIHTHMNHVLWYVPFVLFIFIFTGYFLQSIELKRFTLKTYFIFIMVLVLLVTSHFYFIAQKKDENINRLLKNNIQLPKLDNGPQVSINPTKNKLIYFYNNCKNKDINTRFFLHLIPLDTKSLSENRRKYNFDNLDFNWKNNSISTSSFSKYNKSCIAIRDLPNYKLKAIITGQYNKKGSLWQTGVVNINTLLPKNTELNAFNLGNSNWKNGISRSKSAFFVSNNFININSINIGDKLLFNHSGTRTITNITYLSGYIIIYVDGNKLDSMKDGYPNKIKLIKKEVR